MAVFNAYEATNPRLKKSKPFNDGATAGTAKVSSSRGGKSREELKALGERHGWSVRELSMREIQQMSADETLWQGEFNKEEFDRAFTLAENGRLNRERMPIWNVRRMWGGGATPEEDSAARIAGNQFATRCLQFERTIENAQAIVEWMQAHDLDGTKVESYVSAFNALVEEGKLTPAKAQSADEFLRNHAELHDTRLPPIIISRNAKKVATETFFEQARANTATARSGATSVTEYPQEQRGLPPYTDIEKMSLRNLVRNMSSAALEEKCQNGPSFKEALDSLD